MVQRVLPQQKNTQTSQITRVLDHKNNLFDYPIKKTAILKNVKLAWRHKVKIKKLQILERCCISLLDYKFYP